MGQVESELLDYIKFRLFEEGALSVTATEIMDSVVPGEHPEFRYRPAYRYGLDRLLRRHVINAISDTKGTTHYFIGDYALPELLESLGLRPRRSN